MGGFEFDIELLVSLVEARPVLWDKTDDIYRQERKVTGMERRSYLSSRDFEALGDVQNNGFGEYCHNLLNTAN